MTHFFQIFSHYPSDKKALTNRNKKFPKPNMNKLPQDSASKQVTRQPEPRSADLKQPISPRKQVIN